MKILQLPAGPFFLDSQGRYLPSLTDLVVEFATLQQRTEIEEQLFKLRLQQRCFIALAEQAPKALLVQAPAPQRASLKLFPVEAQRDLPEVSRPPDSLKSVDSINPYSKGRYNP